MPRTDAESVVVEVLRQADGEWTGKSRLFKVFYFAHLYYQTEQPGLLTDWPIARMPQGPGIHESHALFTALESKGLMTVEQVHEGPYPEYRYRLTAKGKAVPLPPADAVHAIEKAVEFCKSKSATELSELTHERSRSWLMSKDGDLLNIAIDTIPDEEYHKRQAELDQLNQHLDDIIRGASS